ncbi:hypothetical protein [Methylobacterium sp. 22177]|uniref:hypothetical protein n=1 Tax=Methylobacterium sp. 22177 TaxID=3453885 RepID=UPI003F85BB10
MTATILPFPDRLALAEAHLNRLHPVGSPGLLATARQSADGVWDEGMIPATTRAIARQVAEAEVQYVSMNRFTRRRHSSLVRSIRAGFLDLDYTRDGLPHAHRPHAEVVFLVLAALESAGIPKPSWITYSGRGIHIVWTFDGVSGQALCRWQRAMKGLRGPRLDADGNLPKRKVEPRVQDFQQRLLPLWQLLKGLGLDRGCCDAARVLRVWGSINHKSGEMCRPAWPASIADISTVPFDAWADATCPYTRREIAEIRDARKFEPTQVKTDTAVPRRPRPFAANKWRLVLDDLMALLDHRGFIARGRRMLWAVFAATAMSQTDGGDAEIWAERIAPLCGLPERELVMAFSGVEAGMHAHAAGEKREYEGKERPAYYDWSYARMVDELGISQDEADAAAVLVLRPDGSKAGRSAAERQRDSRDAREPDRMTRDIALQQKAQDGITAIEALASGLTLTQICAGLRAAGRPSSLNWLKQAIFLAEGELVRIAAIEAASIPASAPVPAEDALPACHGKSRRIVASGPGGSSTSADASGSVPEGEVRVRRYSPRLAEYRTSTAHWTILRIGEGRWTDEIREDLPLDAPDLVPEGIGHRIQASDAGLIDAVLADLAREAARDRRRGGRASSGRSRARIALAPLDPAREAEAYLDASGGSTRHRRALVAA